MSRGRVHETPCMRCVLSKLSAASQTTRSQREPDCRQRQNLRRSSCSLSHDVCFHRQCVQLECKDFCFVVLFKKIIQQILGNGVGSEALRQLQIQERLDDSPSFCSTFALVSCDTSQGSGNAKETICAFLCDYHVCRQYPLCRPRNTEGRVDCIRLRTVGNSDASTRRQCHFSCLLLATRLIACCGTVGTPFIARIKLLSLKILEIWHFICKRLQKIHVDLNYLRATTACQDI